jgi:LysR family glycine cleavage system transcriptional activator
MKKEPALPSRLPPLNSVRAFEAAARHSSFTRAADELFVTPGAVSRQVRILEESLGKPLFDRNYREVELTEAACAYAKAISDAFRQIDGATREFLAAEQARSLHVHAPMTFALLWLMPRLSSFHAEHPQQGLRLASVGTPPSDLVGTEFDIAIKRVARENGVQEATWLFDVELVPVCSPALIAREKLRKPSDLARQTLLYSTARPADWPIWLSEAGVSGVDMQAQVSFGSTSLACRAAMSGYGVAIITHCFAEDHIRSGELVVPFDVRARDGSAYFAVVAAAARSNLQAVDFCDWIAKQAAAERAVGDAETSRRLPRVA